MEVDCRGCAGCCLDWRPLAPVSDHERRGPEEPLDDTYNLVPLTRDDVTDLLDAGYAAAMTPRLWRVEDGSGVEIDGYNLAAIDDKPAFFLGLRHAPKPVAPFGTDATWLQTCVFLDPETLQCRIHDQQEYPTECGAYPGHNLSLGAETECERVETHFGGTRLVDREPPEDDPGPRFGPQAVGHSIFAYPEPSDLEGTVTRLASDELTPEDRAPFVAAAAASSPGTTAVEANRFEAVLDRVRTDESWVDGAIDAWERLANGTNSDPDPDPSLAETVEGARGAPETPGWPV